MKLVLPILALSFSCFGMEEWRPELPSCQVIKSEKDNSLKADESAFTFLVKWDNLHLNTQTIIYTDNGVQDTVELDKKKSFTVNTTPGKHRFVFLSSIDFNEIFTDSIEVLPRHRTTVQLHFRQALQEIHVRKPVVYLYPGKNTDITMKVDPVGDFSFTYPAYNDAWEIMATPEGEIYHNNDKYRYLFWEAEQSINPEFLDQNVGSIVSKKELLTYLESSLKTYGLKASERADFITYWLPILNEANNLYLYFVFNDECDVFASLDIDPKPDNIGRFYMLWSPVEGDIEDIKLKPQEIPVLDRSGFTVIEWGGAQINYRHKPKERL